MAYNALLLFVMRYVSVHTNQELLEDLNVIQAKYFGYGYVSILSDRKLMRDSQLFEDSVKLIASNIPVMVFECKAELSLDSHPYLQQPTHAIVSLDPSLREDCIEVLRDSAIWRPATKTLVYVEDERLANSWLSRFWERTKAIDVTILPKNLPGQFLTWFPYAKNTCTGLVNVTKIKNYNIFPEKITTNLNNCPVSVAAAEIFPYVIAPDKGVDFLILKTFFDRFHLIPSISILSAYEFWNFMTPSGRPAGCLEILYEQKLDIATGGFQHRLEYARFSTLSKSSSEDHLAWFVPVPGFIPSVQKLKSAIPNDNWLWLIGSFSVMTSAIVIANFITNDSQQYFSNSVLDSVSTFLFLPVQNTRSRVLKLLFLVFYIFSCHTTVLFQAALIHVLSNKLTYPPIRSMSDVINRNIRMNFYEIYRGLANVSDSPIWLGLQKKNLHAFAFTPDIPSFAGTEGFMGPEIPMYHYLGKSGLFDSEGRLMFAILNEKFMTLPFSFLLSPGHPLAPFLDDMIQTLLEGGFPIWWRNNHLNEKKVRLYRENQPISLEALTGAFYLFFMTLTAAISVFMLENMHSVVAKWKWESKQKVGREKKLITRKALFTLPYK